MTKKIALEMLEDFKNFLEMKEKRIISVEVNSKDVKDIRILLAQVLKSYSLSLGVIIKELK